MNRRGFFAALAGLLGLSVASKVLDISQPKPVTPTGTVRFYDGTTLLGTATLTTAAMGLGAHTINAIYSGDITFADSGASLEEEIN